MKKFTIAATALAVVASTISFAPAANAANVPASSATFGASCASVGATAAGKGADGSALTCAKETHGSFKGKTIWTYKTWPVLSAAEIVIPNTRTSGFGGFADGVADAMKAEGLLKAEPVVTPNKQATYAMTLDYFNKTLAGKAGKLGVTGFAQVTGALTSKSTTMVSSGVPGARMMAEYSAIAVKADSDFKSIDDVIEALQNNPQNLTIVGGNVGGVDNFVVSQLFSELGIDTKKMNYVPTKTTVSGDLMTYAKYSFGVSGVSEFTKFVKSGDMRILAVTSASKLPGIDAPTFKSKKLDVVVQNWRGIMLPPKTPVAAQKLVIRALDVVQNSKSFNTYLTSQTAFKAFLPGSQWSSFLKGQESSLKRLLISAGLL